MARENMRRERVAGVEAPCPTCKGKGKYTGPEPTWPNCLRCGGYGTIVLFEKETEL